MSAASNHAETNLLKWSLTTDSVTRPTTWYVALFTSDPTDAGSGTEVSGNAYARTSVTFSVTDDTASNTGNVTFPTASGGNWGTVSHIGIYDASTSGNLWYHGSLTASKVVNNGDTFQITTGNLDITLA